MRIFAVACGAALLLAPAAAAKGKLSVGLSDRTPHVARPVTVTVRTGWVVPPDDWLRLIAVAPGYDWYGVVARITDGSSHTAGGFAIPLRRVAPKTWRAVVRLRSRGRWRLVVPNGTHVGFMVPPPTAWMPWVVVRR